MQGLREIQEEFLKAILDRDYSNLSFISSNHKAERLEIYRITIFKNIVNTLKNTFPNIWKLLGDECADDIAYVFASDQTNLPLNGCLDEWGEKFSSFLATKKDLEHLPYLSDYAYYEWLKHLAYISNNASFITPQDLAEIDSELIENVQLTLIPSLFLFKSEFPLHQVHEFLTNPAKHDITLTNEKAFTVIAKPQEEVLTFWVKEDNWLFLEAIQDKHNLTKAVELVQKTYPQFNLAQPIYFLLQHQLISKVMLPKELRYPS